MNELFELSKNETQNIKLQPKISALLKELNQNLYKKENSIKLILLAVLAGESAFLLGEPGTAKSLIAHRISEGFKDLDTTKPENTGYVKYFEYLMSQFSTPDEIFGPVSLQALKNDEYKRITDNYLPKAQFAFLDEIWKASPAIQNSLLTILNEKKFQNGFESQKVPLQGFVAASNELPAKNEGLEAIFDRFLVRIIEEPISSDSTFFKMITSKKNTTAEIKNKIDGNKLRDFQTKAENVEFPENLFEIVRNIRQEIKNYNKHLTEDEEPFLVSDRRWKKIICLLKMSAFLNDRKEINISDFEIVPYCIWSTENQYNKSKKIIKAVMENFIKSYSTHLNELLSKIENQDFKSTNVFQKMINEITQEKQNFDSNINIMEKEAKENIFTQKQLFKIIQKEKTQIDEKLEHITETHKNYLTEQQSQNSVNIKNAFEDGVTPLLIESDPTSDELIQIQGIDIGNKIISKKLYFEDVPLYLVLLKCNKLSLKENLKPVYYNGTEPLDSQNIQSANRLGNINIRPEHNGFRIPTNKEIQTLLKNTNIEKYKTEYIWNGTMAMFITKHTFIPAFNSDATTLKSIYSCISCRIIRGK